MASRWEIETPLGSKCNPCHILLLHSHPTEKNILHIASNYLI